jgi:MFS transporter, FSR family, fosmidomycin resistance protein
LPIEKLAARGPDHTRVGGLAAPLLALIASAHGPRGALLALLVIPPLAIACGLLLRDPAVP